MFDLYIEQTNEPAKFHFYKATFKTDFNISFFKPKKDVCDKCAKYKENRNPTDEEITKYNEHINRKNLGNQEREHDRIRYKDDETVEVVTFGLENTVPVT